VAREWFADPPIGFEFGSEFEGYDWVAGFASVGGLIGALAGVWLSTLETPVVGLERIVRMGLRAVEGRGKQLIEDARVDPVPVGGDLGR
jgi:hypothetical protein